MINNRKSCAQAKRFHFVTHPSFEEADAQRQYAASKPDFEQAEYPNYMPDEVTREVAKRMHYAAYRMSQAADPRVSQSWLRKYFDCRDRVVLGNRKLIYRAVRRWTSGNYQADDMIGECHIVLIKAVAAYNPWMGIRFSTYAFTCLMRALSRLSQRHAADRLARSLSLEGLADGEPKIGLTEERHNTGLQKLDEYLSDENELLSSREKAIILRRFCPSGNNETGTHEEVGKELGLSKERVRQVQVSALDKLRKALVGAPTDSEETS